MKTAVIGRGAETAVADYLKKGGYKILNQNWRTRWCEIDIVAAKGKIAYFVEVKYRGSESQGGGFEYIGSNKLRQLRFAVEFWISQNGWNGDCRLLGAQVSGLNYEHIELVEIG